MEANVTEVCTTVSFHDGRRRYVPIKPDMRRQPVQQRSRQTVEKILESAEQLVVDVGYETFVASPDLLLQATGVSRGSLYAYFSSPQTVLDEIALRVLESSREQVAAITASPPVTWEAAVDRVIDCFDADYRRAVVREIWLNRPLTPHILHEDIATNSSIAAQFYALLTQFPPSFAQFERSHSAVAIEILDRLLRYAYRQTPAGDPALRAEARTAVMAYLSVYA
jgi:AcrR family transcriptional regulator